MNGRPPYPTSPGVRNEHGIPLPTPGAEPPPASTHVQRSQTATPPLGIRAVTIPTPVSVPTGAFQGRQEYPLSPPPLAPVKYPSIGHLLHSPRGEYVVSSVLGAGEFGAVFECVGPFDHLYAVKVVRPANRPYQEVFAEWAREVQRLMSLRHPNVVYIHDAFEQDSLFYLALERCDHALSAMLGTPMEEALVIELARQLLSAVQFLHDNDVVHDDLHPGNVLITHTDRPDVKISDFGISHELRGAPAVRPDVVHHSIMAPEIIASGYTSKQSDLYQVGLLLYWMLTGEPAVALDAPYEQLIHSVSEGFPRKRAEAIGTPFGSLIAKMLRRREQYRYCSAREVWADLRQLPAWQKRQLFPIK